MLLSKKIAKLRRKPLAKPKSPQSNPQRVKENKKTQRCQFVQIPLPTKFLYSHQIYLLYGDLPIMEYNGRIVHDVSFYNEFKLYQEVVIGEMYNQQVMAVKTVSRQDKEYPHWNNLVTKLKNSEDQSLQDWGKAIQIYSQKYSKVMSRQSRKKSKSGPRRKFFADVTTKTENIKKQLFNEHPCMQLKFRLKKHENQLTDIIFNEGFVQELGYSLESFAMVVQQEGLPQLLSYENANSTDFMRVLIDKYFFIENDGHKLNESEIPLIMKGDFVKDIKYRVFFLMNYETNTFGMDVIMAITAKGEPYLRSKTTCTYLNKDFLSNRILQEEETLNMLNIYYGLFIQQKYMNQHRTCTIRELDFPDSNEEEDKNCIIIEKYEEM